MNKLCRFATAAAVVIAASAFATQASANPFGWLGLGYAPTDNGNQVRADLRRVTVEYPSNETPGTIVVDTGEHLPLLRSSRRQGDPLRHRRRP